MITGGLMIIDDEVVVVVGVGKEEDTRR